MIKTLVRVTIVAELPEDDWKLLCHLKEYGEESLMELLSEQAWDIQNEGKTTWEIIKDEGERR